jgi:hypothetical protein
LSLAALYVSQELRFERTERGQHCTLFSANRFLRDLANLLYIINVS